MPLRSEENATLLSDKCLFSKWKVALLNDKENVVLFTKVIDPEKAEHKLSLAMKKLKYSLDSMDKPLLYYADWRKQTLKVVRRIQERSKWSGVCECHFLEMKIRFLHDSHFEELWRILTDNAKTRSTSLMNENANAWKWHSLKVWKPSSNNENCRITFNELI